MKNTYTILWILLAFHVSSAKSQVFVAQPMAIPEVNQCSSSRCLVRQMPHYDQNRDVDLTQWWSHRSFDQSQNRHVWTTMLCVPTTIAMMMDHFLMVHPQQHLRLRAPLDVSMENDNRTTIGLYRVEPPREKINLIANAIGTDRYIGTYWSDTDRFVNESLSFLNPRDHRHYNSPFIMDINWRSPLPGQMTTQDFINLMYNRRKNESSPVLVGYGSYRIEEQVVLGLSFKRFEWRSGHVVALSGHYTVAGEQRLVVQDPWNRTNYEMIVRNITRDSDPDSVFMLFPRNAERISVYQSRNYRPSGFRSFTRMSNTSKARLLNGGQSIRVIDTYGVLPRQR